MNSAQDRAVAAEDDDQFAGSPEFFDGAAVRFSEQARRRLINLERHALPGEFIAQGPSSTRQRPAFSGEQPGRSFSETCEKFFVALGPENGRVHDPRPAPNRQVRFDKDADLFNGAQV